MSHRSFTIGLPIVGGGCYNVEASELSRGHEVNCHQNHQHSRANKSSISCLVLFLDESQHIFHLNKNAKGQALLDSVFQHLELVERDYFSLQFNCQSQSRFTISNSSNIGNCSQSMRWIDPNKKIGKQLKGGPPYVFHFKVKFYVSDPSKLQEEYTRYHLFLQLKKDIISGRLIAPLPTALLLASYAVQSELGDYCPDEHKMGYLSQLRLLPNQTEDMEREICELHKSHKGQTPADAEYNYLDHAKRLDMYGVELHRARDSSDAEIGIGVTSAGLVVFQNNVKLNTFSWAKVIKISFKRRHFFVQLRREGTEIYDNLIGFNLMSYRSCKTLWKSCVEHHTFFRLQTPKPHTTRKFFFFFNLGSKFRYSGKTEYQTMEEGRKRARSERVFVRSPSLHFARQTVPNVNVSINNVVSINNKSSLMNGNVSICNVLPLGTPTAVCSLSRAHSHQQNNNHVHTPQQQQLPPPPSSSSSSSAVAVGCTVRPYESFSHKIQISESCTQRPRPAWGETSDVDYDTSISVNKNRNSCSSCTSVPGNAFCPSAISLKSLPYIDKEPTPTPPPVAIPTPTPASTNVTTRTLCECQYHSHDHRDQQVSLTSPSAINTGAASLTFSDQESQPPSSPPFITIYMKPDNEGRFGFNVKGGADQNLPVLVSRVAPNTPAANAVPKLSEGDQVVNINGHDVHGLAHDEIVQLIRATRERSPPQLVLIIRPNVYNGTASDASDEPDFQYIPVDISPTSRNFTRKNPLAESMLLLNDGLESGALVAQFEQLFRKKTGETMNAAKLCENMAKNRYRDISPYDSTRVVLNDSLTGDYINASFVNMKIAGSGIVNSYIATQGPLGNTCDDFWQMIWEQGSTLIVMVTPLMERGRIKCHKYWPDVDASDNETTYGLVKVKCLKEIETPALIERQFRMRYHKTDVEQTVSHLQYLAWPDHSCPEDATHFLDLVMRVRKFRESTPEQRPIIIHCSAGIGRTGVLILMETAICLIEANEPVYPLDIVRTMREQRAMLIQTSTQYRFVCEAIYKVYKDAIVKPLSDEHEKNDSHDADR